MHQNTKAIEAEYDKGVIALVAVADAKAEALVREAVAGITAMKVSRIRFSTDTWYIYIEQGMYERIDIRRWVYGLKHGQPDGPPFQWGKDKSKIRDLCDLLDWWDRLTSGRSFKIEGEANAAPG